MKGFFTEETLQQQGFPNLYRFLRTYYDLNPHWEQVNLEEVMTHLYYVSAGTYPVAAFRSTGPSRAREELNEHIYKRLVLGPAYRAVREPESDDASLLRTVFLDRYGRIPFFLEPQTSQSAHESRKPLKKTAGNV